VAEREAGGKLRIYYAIYRLNLSFANIVAHCRTLGASGILTRKYAHLYQSFAQELQAEINEDVAMMLASTEADDMFRFGKVRQAWEKELRDPDDVFLLAEERRKEIARQKRKARPATHKKASTSRSGTSAPRPRKARANLAP
jgi:hypothetical protein